MSQTKQTANLFLAFQHDLEALLQVAPSLIVVFETDGTILSANDEAVRIIHAYGNKLVGKNIFGIFQFSDGSFDAQVLQVTRSQKMATLEGIHNGRVLSCILYPILDERQKVVRIALLAQDHTARRRAEDQVRSLTLDLERKVLQRTGELHRANQQLRQEKRRAEMLADFSKVLVEHVYEYQEFIQYISNDIVRQIGDGCIIILFSSDGTELEIASMSHRSNVILQEMQHVSGRQKYPIQEVGLAEWMLKREKYIGEDLSYEQVCQLIPPDFSPMVSKNGFKGLIGIPLLVHDRVLGGIFTARHRRESQPYSPDDISFLQSIAGPLALAIENARLFDQAKDHRQRLRGISQRLVKLQEDQFKRLGQELHNHIGQDLTAIHINLSLIESMLPENTTDAIRQRLAGANHLVTESVAHIRNIMSDFLPPMLEHYGLTAALLWYAQKFTNRTKIIVTVNDYNLKDLRLASDIELSLFRITQEALNNIAKHAQVTQAEIELKDTGNYTVLSIRDNGIGFNLRDVLARQGEHWGLFIMKERARAIKASFNITSIVGEGTKITIQVLRNQ